MSRRKYGRGRRIRSLDTLARQEFVWLRGRPYHMGWVRGWQFAMVIQLMQCGLLYTVRKIESEVKK